MRTTGHCLRVAAFIDWPGGKPGGHSHGWGWCGFTSSKLTMSQTLSFIAENICWAGADVQWRFSFCVPPTFNNFSSVYHSDRKSKFTHTHTLFFGFIIGYYKMLNTVPVLYSRSLEFICLIYSSVYLLIPNSQVILPSLPFGNQKFVFYVCEQISSFVSFENDPPYKGKYI